MEEEASKEKERMDDQSKELHLPTFRIWLCGALRVERRVGTAYEAVRTSEWGGSSYPRLLLKTLLLCSGRQARREALLEMLWPDADPEQAAQNLNTATTKLRKVLEPAKGRASLLITEDDYKHYLLEGQHLIWVDTDAALALLKEVERVGRMNREALPLLEEATAYFNRGPFLDGEEGQWALGKRATVERVQYRSRRWLAEAYEQQGMPGQAEMILSTLLEEDPFDEDALCCLMALLHRQGMTQKALRLFEQACKAFNEEGMELTEAMKTLAAQFQAERHRPPLIPTAPDSSYGVIPFFQPDNQKNRMFPQFTTAISQGIILAAKELSKEETITSFAAKTYRLPRKLSLDTLVYKRNIRLALHLHRTSHAQGLLQDVCADIQDLEQLERQARGHDLYEVKELLIGNHLLATKIVKDQRQFARASRYADNAVQVAKSLEDGDFIATTKYTRGCVKLEWAQFGTVKDGTLQLDQKKVQDAMRDFQDVLALVRVQRAPLHPQLHGFTYLQLGRAYSLLYDTWNGSAETNPLTFVDQAESMVDRAVIEDAYTRLIMTGTVSGLHWGAYHLNKTEIFLAMGMQDQALAELKCLRQLTGRTYTQDETRNQAWSNMVTAEVLIGLEAYPEATSTLRSALLMCRSINSLQNAATIKDIHSRLVISPYGTSTDVQEIGAMLKEWYGRA
jgi:DNA-binding SARP family transcriptional activator